jgi:hypothetical protein
MKAQRIAKFVVLGIVFFVVFGFVIMALWNWLMPALFGLPKIGYWQALGIFLLSKLIFGGFRGGGGPHRDWRHRMKERWGKMTPEEREKFRQTLNHWGEHLEPPQPKPTA